MEIDILKQMISVIRVEEQRRASLPTDENSNFAYDQWLFTDEPFVNELCLMLLVTLRHQVGRELVWLAARAADDGKEISGQQYYDNISQLQKPKGWEKIKDRLKLESCEGYPYIEVLRLLANSYKHDPYMEPDRKLLELLQLETGVNYDLLPESNSLREGLSAFLGLGKDSTYCDIAERFVDIANDFLGTVQNRTKLSRVKRSPVSFNPRDFAH